jgi:hypothetical protein
MRTLLAIPIAATLSPAAASAQTLEAPTQPTLNLTLQDRYTVKEIIKDLRLASAPGKQDVSIGTEIPSSIRLETMPAEVTAKVPKIKSHLFFVEDNKIVLVEAKDRKIVGVIE